VRDCSSHLRLSRLFYEAYRGPRLAALPENRPRRNQVAPQIEQSIAVELRRFRLSPRLVLRIDAVSNASLAALFLAASWDDLFEFFGLPLPQPAWYAQLLGAALVAIAVLEWRLAGTAAARATAGAVALGSALAAGILVAWLAAGKSGADSHGIVVLWSAAAFLALAAALHVLALSRAGS
jgi:hypothetical protein